MTKKKINGVPKKPKETGTWYKSLIEGQAKAEYYRHFIKKLNTITLEYFGPDETARVLKAVGSKKLKVPGIESFLFDYNDVSDPSLQLYNICTSVEELVIRTLVFLKKKRERGETDILIKDFFFVLSDLSQNTDLYPLTRIKEILKNFVSSLISVLNPTPYNFVIVEPSWANEIGAQLNLNTKQYKNIFYSLLSVIEELKNAAKDIKTYIPQLKIIYPVYYDSRDNQLSYIVTHFRLTDRPTIATNALKGIPDLSQDTSQLRSALEYLKDRTNLPFINIDAILLELQNIGCSSLLKRYPFKNSLTRVFRGNHTPLNYFNNFKIHPLFVAKETFERCFRPYFCEVQIDCEKIKKENIESFIDAAKAINLTKGYYMKTKRNIDTLTFKITLLNVKDITKEFLEFVQNKIARIQSLTRKKFIVEIYYDPDTIGKKVPESSVSHLRIISDVHTDYNAGHNYIFNFGDDFVINCGDTAGDALTAARWIQTYMKQGIDVIGNHLGYSPAFPERNGIQNMETYGNTIHITNTKGEQVKALANIINTNTVSLLSNSFTEKFGIIFIGTCLYTNFDLYGKEHREESMSYAKKYMNDFRLPVIEGKNYYTQNKNGEWMFNCLKKSERKVRPFAPSDHAFYFQFSFNYIKEIVERYKGKPIVIVTHHAPSPYSIDEKYEGSMLNPAFASDLNQFIINHPQIRLWAHGHIHTPCDYILGETRVVCCPFGYNNENNFNLPYEYGMRIAIEDIKSKKSWRKLLAREILKGRIQAYNY